MLRSLYHQVIKLSGHPHSLAILALISFIESSFFPIPPDVLLIPMILARPRRAWVIALVCTAASVLGGIAGYMIGSLLFEQIGQPLLRFYGYGDRYQIFAAWYHRWGAWAVLIAGVTPFPYKVATILSGMTHLDFLVFVTASTLARALRFFAVSALLWKFGTKISRFIDRWFGVLTVVFILMLFGGFAILGML